jgi:hypothetical protein
MIKAGIIDPTKVVRTALEDAASVAGLIITTEAMVAEKPEKKRRQRARHLPSFERRKTSGLRDSDSPQPLAASTR